MLEEGVCNMKKEEKVSQTLPKEERERIINNTSEEHKELQRQILDPNRQERITVARMFKDTKENPKKEDSLLKIIVLKGILPSLLASGFVTFALTMAFELTGKMIWFMGGTLFFIGMILHALFVVGPNISY